MWSNAVRFTVPVSGGNTLAPNLLNLVVGDTHTIQALNPAGQPVTGLTWTSSDPNVVSLSTADPPVITALAPGHVTITAGTASADVTVSADALSVGTVLWSNPGNGAGVTKIVPAVPSPSGVADVFAFQADGTVQAITSDGATAWTADVAQAASGYLRGAVVPDFQGGLVVREQIEGVTSIAKLDGITGQRYPAYAPTGTSRLAASIFILQPLAVHPDGTIFAVQNNSNASGFPVADTLIGIDPITGTQKFPGVPIGPPEAEGLWELGLMIGGDGYAYLAYAYKVFNSLQAGVVSYSIKLLRVNSSGVYDNIAISDWRGPNGDGLPLAWVNLITNGDTGTLLSWSLNAYSGSARPEFHMASTAGASASLISLPEVPGQTGEVVPLLQAQDGSFVGSYYTEGFINNMILGDNNLLASPNAERCAA